MRALKLGAVDFFPKAGVAADLDSVATEIADRIRAAAQARVARPRSITPRRPDTVRPAALAALAARPAGAPEG